MYSYDGINWETGIAPDAYFNACVYGVDKFVGGSDIGIYTSTTGLGSSVSLTFPTGTDMTALAADDAVSQTTFFDEPLESFLVTAGPIYTNQLSATSGNVSNGKKSFNGSLDTGGSLDNLTGKLVFTLAEPISGLLEIYNNSFHPTDVYLNWEVFYGSNQSITVNNTAGVGAGAIPVGTLSNITRIEASSPSQNSNPIIYAIILDGETLVDKNVALTFAAGTDMSVLKIGDRIQQLGRAGGFIAAPITGTTVKIGGDDRDPALFTNGENVVRSEEVTATGTVGSITDTTANLSKSSGTWVDGIDVTTGDKTTSGTVAGVAGTTATLSSSTGPFFDGLNVTGPQKTITEANTRLYCAFDSDGNITDLQNNPQNPPYTTTDLNPGLTFTFPATFPSGQTPDEELPEGTTFTVEVTAENSAGTSGPLSDTVQPEPDEPGVPLAGLTTLYSGNNESQTIVNGINLASNDGLVWMKNRSNPSSTDYWHILQNTLRGNSVSLSSNASSGEFARTNAITSFNSDGFTIGSQNEVNDSDGEFVAWTFGKAAGYFDVQVIDVPAGSAATYSHDLGVKPGFIITKSLAGNGEWFCYHSSLSTQQSLSLDTTAAAFTGSNSMWVEEPTDTTFGYDSNNFGSGDRVVYLFAEDTPDVIKCGSYTSGAAPKKITTGFPVNWVLIKDATGNNGNYNWTIFDKARGVGNKLQPNIDKEEQNQASSLISFDSDGFTLGSAGEVNDPTSNTYIYIAIAEPPITRSQTAEEYAETQLKLLSYKNRKTVTQGEDALEVRQSLEDQLKERGYSPEEIARVFNPPNDE